jgi:hypothetical protein
MAPSKPSAATAPFSKDERVLCFHHDMLYEAKVLDSRPTEDSQSWQYRIHYKGWKNTVRLPHLIYFLALKRHDLVVQVGRSEVNHFQLRKTALLPSFSHYLYCNSETKMYSFLLSFCQSLKQWLSFRSPRAFLTT